MLAGNMTTTTVNHQLSAAQQHRQAEIVATLVAMGDRQATVSAEQGDRDRLIRKLAAKPFGWSNRKIAGLVGMSHQNVALIVGSRREPAPAEAQP